MPTQGDFDNEFPYYAKGTTKAAQTGKQTDGPITNNPTNIFDVLTASTIEIKTGGVFNGNYSILKGTLKLQNSARIWNDDGNSANPSYSFGSNVGSGIYYKLPLGLTKHLIGMSIDQTLAMEFGRWTSADTDVAGLIDGTNAGGMIMAPPNGHLMIGLTDDSVGDSFTIISGGGNWSSDETWDTVIARFHADGRTVFGNVATVPQGGRLVTMIAESTTFLPLLTWSKVVATSAQTVQIMRLGTDTTVIDSANYFTLYRRGDGTTIGSVNGNGSGGIAYNTTSDERLKSDIRAPEGTEDFDLIDWRTFEIEGQTEHGVVAQELWSHESLRKYVTEGEEDEPWQVDYSSLVRVIGPKVAELSRRMEAAGI